MKLLKNHVKSVEKSYNFLLQGHCLWVTSVPQVGMEGDATALGQVMLENATMYCSLGGASVI